MNAAVGTALVVGLAAGLGIGYVAFGTGAERVREAEESTQEADQRAEGLSTENQRLRKELASTKRGQQAAARDVASLEARVAELAAPAAPAAAAAEDPSASEPEKPVYGPGEEWKAALDHGPVHAFDEFTEALEAVDWVSLSEHMQEMVGKVREITTELRDGAQPDPALSGEVQKHNGFLLVEYVKIVQHGVPGAHPNGAFTHPAVMVNAIAGTLLAADLPLTKAQSEKLDAVGRDFVARDQARLGSYGDETLALAKRVEEVQLKRKFFTAAFAILTPAQYDAVSPEPSRGRIRADLFCEGLLYVAGVQHLGFTGTTDLAEKTTSLVAAHLGLDDAGRETARDIVDAWVSELPATVLDHQLDALGQAGLVEAAAITRCAEQVVTLFERLRQSLDLDERARGKLLNEGVTLFLVRTD